jgi:hypothetical protein
MIWNDDIPPLNLCNYNLSDKWDDMERIKKRNHMIVQAFKNEIDLKTKVERDRTKYNRKEKHKKDY